MTELDPTYIADLQAGPVDLQQDFPVTAIQAQEPVVFAYPPLTREQEDFALAVVEYGGNIAAAYKAAFGDDAKMPTARGKELMGLPAVALKIKAITDSVEDACLISVGAHLTELARIRDLSIATGELKVAFSAERSRGEAVGIYQKHDAKNKNPGGNQVVIQVNMASPHDKDI
jgi:hypothetical protein